MLGPYLHDTDDGALFALTHHDIQFIGASHAAGGRAEAGHNPADHTASARTLSETPVQSNGPLPRHGQPASGGVDPGSAAAFSDVPDQLGHISTNNHCGDSSTGDRALCRNGAEA